MIITTYMIIWLPHKIHRWAIILIFLPTIWILHYFCFVFHATAIWNARYLQAVQKDTTVKERRQRFFSSHVFPLFRSEIKSWKLIWGEQQVGEVCQWLIKFQWTAESESESQQSIASSQEFSTPDFGESLFPFQHWNLRNRVRVILLQQRSPQKIENQKKIYSRFSF